MKKTLTFILSIICMLTSCKRTTIEDGETYSIWETTHESFDDENGFEICRSSLWVDCEFIKSLPKPVKTIIAHYSVFIPPNDFERNLAQALGGFATLEEAQQTLLKNWNAEKPDFDYSPRTLRMKKTKQSYFFEVYEAYAYDYVNDVAGSNYAFEFIIDKDEKITYQGKIKIIPQ